MEKPIYKSKKHLAYAFTSALLLLAILMKAESVAEHLAMALELALPVLIGGQALIDHKAASPSGGEPQ